MSERKAKILLWAIAIAILVLGYVNMVLESRAQQVTNPIPNAGTYGAYNSSPPTCTNGTGCWFQTDANGNQKVVLAAGSAIIGTVAIDQTTRGTTNGVTVVNTSGTAWDPTVASQVVGNVAAAATDSGNPVKGGAIYRSTPPTYTDGQRTEFLTDSRGNVKVSLANGASAASIGQPAFTGQSYQNALFVNSIPLLVNNSGTLDSGFACNQSAVINVTAGNTTEIVSLTASQIVRVCSFVISMSATGTAQFVYGTGSNCGSGTTNLTGAMSLLTSTPLAISGGGGNALFRGAVSNAVCVAAVTGNAVGFLTYAKF